MPDLGGWKLLFSIWLHGLLLRKQQHQPQASGGQQHEAISKSHEWPQHRNANNGGGSGGDACESEDSRWCHSPSSSATSWTMLCSITNRSRVVRVSSDVGMVAGFSLSWASISVITGSTAAEIFDIPIVTHETLSVVRMTPRQRGRGVRHDCHMFGRSFVECLFSNVDRVRPDLEAIT